MQRKCLQLMLSVLFLLCLPWASTPAFGSAQQVGVRIPASDNTSLIQSLSVSQPWIDYGSFLWSTTTADKLAELDQAGITYSAIDNPYTLTLGGQSFDPLEIPPSFTTGWDQPAQSPVGSLHLVQFFGPTMQAWLQSLEDQGVRIIQYIHPFTYVVWADTTQLHSISSQDFIRWAGDFLPAYAVQPQNRLLSSDQILVRALFYPAAGLQSTLDSLHTLGANQIETVSGADPAFDLLTFYIPGDQLLAAASLPGVYSLQPVPTDGGDRGELSNQINAGNYDLSNRAYPGYLNWLSRLNLSGEGVIIANVDSGIDQSHPDLINRMLPCIGSTCGGGAISNHGTHTAGIMAGDGSSGTRDLNGFLRGLGMAPGANLIEQVYNPTYQQPDGMLTLMTQSSQNGALISGNSWGPSATPLGYDADTRLVDIGVRDADPLQPGNQSLSYILSIMNGYGGVSTQGTPDEAKNTFTIGSTYLQNSYGDQLSNIDDISANSAHGPALDGRKIPHLVAPGYYVDSTQPGASYTLMGGTSMASPNVSGAAALFIERYRRLTGADPSPAMIKAAFLPVAEDLAGHYDADGVPLGHPFDSKQGWGRLDAGAVLDPAHSVTYYDQPFVFDSTGEQWSVDIPVSNPFNQLRVMLVWTDAPGHGLGGITPAWVNDLDLSLKINAKTYLGNYFGANGLSLAGGVPDGKNNTEGIFLNNLPAGTHELTVTASQIGGDGIPNLGDITDQDFALVIYYYENPEVYQSIFTIFFYNYHMP